ncbi:C6 zinc finger domain protein, partial [Aspergillus heteromorphus CBS 117.55]
QVDLPSRLHDSTSAPGFGTQTNLHVAGHTLGNLCTSNGLPFFSPSGQQWVKSCTGEDVDQAYFSPQPSVSYEAASSGALQPLMLPDKGILHNLLHEWEAQIFSLLFPFINREFFHSTIDAAYHGRTSTISPGTASARACVYAFTALCLSMSHQVSGSDLMNAEDYINEAFGLLPSMFMDSFTIDGLQTLAMLVICSFAMLGNVHLVELALSSANRFIIHLKGHLAPVYTNQEQFRRDSHIRNLFWVCFLFDKEFSLRTGDLPCIDDNLCDLTLPADTSEGSSPEFVACLRIAVLQSQIYRGLYSVPALRQTDAQLLGTIRDLDNALEVWRSSVPFSNRPRFNDRDSHALSTPDTIFQLQYLYCMTMIHQASGRCSSWVQNKDTSEAGSSLAISVEASRSLLQKLLDDRLHLDRNNLRFCLPYFITAICHIFCNILLKPVAHSSRDDLHLIVSVPRHVRARLSAEMTLPVKQVDVFEGFVMELERLSLRAFQNAQGV